MLDIRTTEIFDAWFDGLRDRTGKRRIQARIDRLAMGNPGDRKSVGASVTELRVDHGPGYRIYYVQRGFLLIVLLCGGDKSSQEADIRAAHKMLRHLDWE
jgi:putative addiction module killer protein